MTIMEAHELQDRYPELLGHIHVFEIEQKWSEYSKSKGYRWLISTKDTVKKVFSIT